MYVKENEKEKYEWALAVTKDILKLSRNTIIVNMKFMNVAIGNLNFQNYEGSLGIDGKNFTVPWETTENY